MSEARGHEGAGAILEFAERLRSRREEQPERLQTFENWVVFRVSHRTMALPVSHVREILRVPPFTGVPNAPKPVAGVMNLRGHVLPLVNGHALFGLPPSFDTDLSRVLVFLLDGREIGILVDEAIGLEKLQVELFQPAPGTDPMAALARGVYPRGAGGASDGEPLLLLEAALLFSQQEVSLN